MIRGFTCSAFDLLHPGHLFLLRESKRRCEYLVVGLHVNPHVERPIKHKPIQSVFERYMQLVATRWVDEVIPYETEADLVNLLKTCDLTVRFVGDEYRNREVTGSGLVPIEYIPRKHNYSTTELRRRIQK